MNEDKKRKQKRRKGFFITSFGASEELLARIDEAVKEQNANSSGHALNRSEWIRRAVERDLAHRDRSRAKKIVGVVADASKAESTAYGNSIGSEPDSTTPSP